MPNLQLYYDGDMDYLENITSCGKVENCVVLSEFEANLSKEEVQNGNGGGCKKEVCSECHGEVIRQPQVYFQFVDVPRWAMRCAQGCVNL